MPLFAIGFSILLLDGQVGPFSFMLRRVIALVGFASLALVPSHGQPRLGFAARAVFVASLVLMVWAPSAPIALASLVVAVSIDARTASADVGTRLPDGLAQASLTYLAVRSAAELVPQAGAVAGLVSAEAHEWVQHVGGPDVLLSVTALGGYPVMLGAIYLLWRWRLAGGLGRLSLAVAGPVIWFALLPVVIPHAKSGAIELFRRGIMYGSACFGVVALAEVFLPESSLRAGGTRRGWRMLDAAPCIAAAVAGVCLVGISLIGPATGRKVVVHNFGGLDWERPTYGRFGAFSGGMFGLLPVYCRAEGYEFDVVGKETIGDAELAGAQVLVLINSPKAWAESERRAVLRFVEHGGSLLVLGDHTDVFGLMAGFNGLLEPFGIRFRFDSAYKARPTWRGCQAAAPDAVSTRWDQDNPGVAVGASLELNRDARPLLNGRYAHSDAGVRENIVGSFLGNYRYDAGEPLGDVVLVATANRGRGRVVVWGDTSTFQGSLHGTYERAVGPLLAWLSRPAAWTERPLTRRLSAALLIAAVLWLFARRSSPGVTAGVAASLLAGMVLAYGANLPALSTPLRIADDTVLIDKSHLPATGHYEARVNSIGPVYTNLLRAGFRVAELNRWDRGRIANSRGIVVVAPQRSFTEQEVADLLVAEESGKVVLLAVGHEDQWGARPLLAAHGLALEPRPLGTVPKSGFIEHNRLREQPRFLDAWPIVTLDGGNPATSPNVEVLYRIGDDVIALFRRRGRGGLLLFADSRFFSTMNIEDVSGHWPGNLALIHDLFRRYLGADPSSVHPLFPSPPKPAR